MRQQKPSSPGLFPFLLHSHSIHGCLVCPSVLFFRHAYLSGDFFFLNASADSCACLLLAGSSGVSFRFVCFFRCPRAYPSSKRVFCFLRSFGQQQRRASPLPSEGVPSPASSVRLSFEPPGLRCFSHGPMRRRGNFTTEQAVPTSFLSCLSLCSPFSFVFVFSPIDPDGAVSGGSYQLRPYAAAMDLVLPIVAPVF